MAGDRDLAVSFAQAYFPARTASGWEMLSATGVRGLRLLHESGRFRSMLLTEAQPEAAELLAANAAAFPGAIARGADAHDPPREGPFDYVDVDPYGSPLPFLDVAIASVRPGGVLAVTATDLMVLAGAQAAACERLYGARPVRGRLGPEGGLRILWAALARAARAHGRRVRPMLSFARGHHLRCYAALESDPDGVEDPVHRIEPSTWDGPALGAGGPFGPLWLGPLGDPTVVARLKPPSAPAEPTQTPRWITLLQAEVHVSRPFYYEANVLAGQLGLPSPAPKAAFLRELDALGYRSAPTHARPEGFRTEAPRKVVEEVARRLAAGQSQKARVRA